MSHSLRRTPLHAEHLSLGARMAPFAGFDMPLWYDSAIEEHLAVRSRAGVFDVSHMGEFRVRGGGAAAALDGILTNDIGNLAPGRARYTVMCTPQGGIVDDLIVYRLAADEFFVCVNAARRSADFEWLAGHLPDGVSLTDESDDWALLAVQGPEAPSVVADVLGAPSLAEQRPFRMQSCNWNDTTILTATTGYTGERGFELFVPCDAAVELWRSLLAAGVKPCGLAARDSLRLEMGYCLYGQDIDETTTPLEAGLDWVVRLDKGDFIGRNALLEQRQRGIRRRLVGFVVEGRGIARHGHELFDGDRRVGTVTSGGYSPVLQRGIGLGYVPRELATEGLHLQAQVRRRRLGVRLARPPFLRDHRSA